MLRCPQKSAGEFKVELRIAHHPEDYRVQIGGHAPVFQYESNGLVKKNADGTSVILDDSPVVSPTMPYEGELCPCEVDWLNGVPGLAYRPEYEFTVTKLHK